LSDRSSEPPDRPAALDYGLVFIARDLEILLVAFVVTIDLALLYRFFATGAAAATSLPRRRISR